MFGVIHPKRPFQLRDETGNRGSPCLYLTWMLYGSWMALDLHLSDYQCVYDKKDLRDGVRGVLPRLYGEGGPSE